MRLFFVAVLLSSLTPSLRAQRSVSPAPGREAAVGDPGSVLGLFRLNDVLQSFHGTIGERDRFASALASLGDLDGNGNLEYAMGAPGDFQERGALWIFSLEPDRTVALTLKYGPIERLPFEIDVGDHFGAAVSAIGDVDGNGVPDLAVGAPGDDDGTAPPFSNSGAVWLLLFGLDGNIHGHRKLSRTAGGFPGAIQAGDAFGSALTAIGDLDGNGVPDLAVGAAGDNEGGNNRGALWVLFLAPDLTVLAARKIGQGQGGFAGTLANGDQLGASVVNMGDLDGDGRPEVAVGASSVSNGDVWMLSLQADGTTTRSERIHVGSPSGAESLANLGDLDHDGVADLAVGDVLQNVVDPLGAVHVLFLASDGSVRASTSFGPPSLPGVGPIEGDFGAALVAPGDTDGDGDLELAVGVPGLSRRLENMGGFLLYDLSTSGAPTGPPTLIDARAARLPVAPNYLTGNPTGYGASLATLGDLDGDGFQEVAIGAPGDDDGGTDLGAVWIHYLSQTGGLRVKKLSAYTTSLPLAAGDRFGESIAALGDLDGNGVMDMAVAAPRTSTPGGIWVLFLTPSGSILNRHLITPAEAGVAALRFATRLDTVWDVDLDGLPELLAQNSGGMRLLYLRSDGTVRSSVGVASLTSLSFPVLDYGPSPSGHRNLLTAQGQQLERYELLPSGATQRTGTTSLGSSIASLAALGDLDGNGAIDIATSRQGRVQLVLLEPDLSRREERSFQAGRSPSAITALGDLTGDGVPDVGGTTSFGESTSVFLTSLGGHGTLDFERRDTPDPFVNENGRALVPELTGFTFALAGLGANLGPAAFDSSPSGPNAGGQDPDLLVNSGRILILQDSLRGTQSRPGIFDVPNDDADGGTFELVPRRPIRPLSLRLIDIDVGASQQALVVLHDDSGGRRTFDVPAGFTEDRALQGGSGWRRLDLTTLTPQAGFQATATAVQTSGFQDRRVVRIEITLGSSGAIDDLVYDPYP